MRFGPVAASSSGVQYLLFVRDAKVMAQRFAPDRLELLGEPFVVLEAAPYEDDGRVAISASSDGTLAYRGGGDRTVNSRFAWLDRSGNFLTPAAVVIERFTLVSPDHIDYQATITDPQTFSEPWTIRMPLYRMIEDNAQLLEFKCVPFAEELLYKDLELPEASAQ